MGTASDNLRDYGVQDDLPSPWAISFSRRIFDLTFASTVLILSAPVMAATAIVVRVSSKGPILFRQTRIGLHGRSFRIFKFRTMQSHLAGSGPSVTTADDKRLTAVGRLLRRTKLDEIPQLLNVLRGDMSFVGPRPKLPHHQIYTLKVRPGITGPASLVFRNEEFMLRGIPAHELDNVQLNVLLPRKRELDESYMRHATFLSDLGMILRTVCRQARAGQSEPVLEAEDLDSLRSSLAESVMQVEEELTAAEGRPQRVLA